MALIGRAAASSALRRWSCAAERLVQHSQRRLATVAVGISGGVDSAVAALLLKRQGHEVIGLHMRSWDVKDESVPEGEMSCVEKERHDAERLCRHLGIGFHEVDFVREYWSLVFEPFLQSYRHGTTPNPDVACNRYIKFDLFHQHALSLGAQHVATGHYARLRRDERTGRMQLLKAVDESKDQSYFLSCVQQQALPQVIFPLGGLPKVEVRRLAREAELHVASKKDSVGICFVGKRRFGRFIAEYLECTSGPFVCVETGMTVGTHRGHPLYTPGAKARIGGLAEQEDRKKWYVVAKSAQENTVYVCLGADHRALKTSALLTDTPSWVAGDAPDALRLANESVLRCQARVRYQQPLNACEVRLSEDRLDVAFEQPIDYVAEQQVLAMYDGEVCLGGATISQRLENVMPLEGVQIHG
ncbi:hypothetical protein AB1Y20_023506 [Prymnesium parvum]|uniref:tRNA-5-taurinomethyluridine 2-sulfurtransferase n=1 Tax=Prymnesium parvum TaxID=97485 RepID=A0AB34JGF7_PRYPA